MPSATSLIMPPGDIVRSAVAALQVDQPLVAANEVVNAALGRLSTLGRQDALFSDAGLGLREAWVGVKFGLAAGYTDFRLAQKAQEGFDLTLSRPGDAWSFDVTEAVDPLRDREAEYVRADGFQHEGHDEITHQHGLFSKVVGNRLKKKQAPTRDVLVYVNTGWLPEDGDLERAFARWHDAFRGSFRSAHLLIRDGIVRIAPDLHELTPWRR